MNHWPFIIGAYVLGLGGTALLLANSYVSMRKAEAAAEALKGDR